MASSVVIKVQYGDTLRRFNASVSGDQHLDVNMEGLRLKICSLFNLPSNANLNLTYRDEDNDLVTLADDEDLHDVVRQGLNPVRITVDLKTDKTTPTYATSGASSTPKKSSSLNSQQKFVPNIPEVLNSVSEPLLDAVSKISAELATNAALTSPILADLMDGLLKMGTPKVDGHTGGSAGPKQGAGNGKINDFIDEEIKHNDTQASSSVHQSPKSIHATKEAEPKRACPSYSFSHNRKNTNSGFCSHKLSASRSTKKNKEVNGNSAGTLGVNDQCMKDSNDSMKKHASSKKEASEPSFGGNRSFQFGGSSSKPYIGSCPFSGWPCGPEQFYIGQSNPPIHPFSPYAPYFNKVDGIGMAPVFHKGVRCDGCGVLPITGPRFKSKVKHDYDLCSICFGQRGNGVDYTRIDLPLNQRHPWLAKGPVDVGRIKCGDVTSEHVMPMMRRSAGKHAHSRLDSRFIMDVNVTDGTVMAPLTSFTKIWRMHNNGTLPWKRGLKLLYIGGDRFSASDSTEIELPVKGLHIGKEIDVAVDFVAPEFPGQYVSYWRMAEPSGREFGQRVWVSIQVDASMDLANQSSPKLNLNIHPETTGALTPQVDDSEPAQNVEAGDSGFSSMVEQAEDLNFPINDDLLVASDVLCPSNAATSSSPTSPSPADNGASPSLVDNGACTEASILSNPDVAADGDHQPPSAPPANLYPVINMSDLPSASCSIDKNDKNDLINDQGKTNVEETLLKELEEMGFKQVDLNKKVLRVNNYDLEQSVDELCGVSEWDPILEELQEMGFKDKETNKKLLEKNNGSITRVVMDLIAGEAPKK